MWLPKHTLPCPFSPIPETWQKASQFLAKLVFSSQWSERSSKTGTKQAAGVQGTGLGGERTRPTDKGREVTEPFYLLWVMGKAWRCSAGALLSSLTQPMRIRGAEPQGAHGSWIAPGTAYLVAQLSSEPFCSFPSRSKNCICWAQEAALSLMKKLQLEEKHHLQNSYSYEVLLNAKFGLLAAEYQR